MKYLPTIAAIAAAGITQASLSAPASAQSRLATLPMGQYQCALPGDATGVPFRVQEELSFRITGASSYRTETARGTYLLEGDTVTFTRGPRKDMKLKRMRTGLLQWVKEDGTLGRIRCSRIGK